MAKEYYSKETKEARHLLAVLKQLQRWRRDNHVPNHYRMPEPKEIGVAIDFAIEVMERGLDIMQGTDWAMADTDDAPPRWSKDKQAKERHGERKWRRRR